MEMARKKERAARKNKSAYDYEHNCDVESNTCVNEEDTRSIGSDKNIQSCDMDIETKHEDDILEKVLCGDLVKLN